MIAQDLHNWGFNLWMMIGCFGWIIILAPPVIVGLLYLRILLRRGRIRRAVAEHYRRTHLSNGAPYPPSGRGVCQRCKLAKDKVYSLKSGTRLCHECFGLLLASELARRKDEEDVSK